MSEGRNFFSCVVERPSTDNCHLGIYSSNIEETLKMSYTGKKYFKRFKDYTREKVVNVVH